MNKSRCTTRTKFSYSDDRALLQFLISELKAGSEDAKNAFGNKVWETAIKKRILSSISHSVASVRDRFRRQIWPFLDLQPVTQEERAFLKKHVRSAPKKDDAASSTSGNEEENEDETERDGYLLKVESFANKPSAVKRKLSDLKLVRQNLESEASRISPVKKLNPVVEVEENSSKQPKPKRVRRRLISPAKQIFPDQGVLEETESAKPAIIQETKADSTNMDTTDKATTSQADADAAIDPERPEENAQAHGGDLVPANDPQAQAKSKIIDIDLDSPEAKDALWGMVNSDKLPLTKLPAFLKKMKKMADIAKTYGSTMDSVEKQAKELKSLASVEGKMKGELEKRDH